MHDLIVVGAGTAGCVLAERLTASGRLRVLLLEAGGEPSSPFVKIPAGFTKLFKSRWDWNFESEPQQAAGGRKVYIPRGKMLGGSSNMNAQIHTWCHPADYNEWAAAGATGWSWSDVHPVFRAQECWLGECADGSRGTAGPMFISPNRHVNPISKAFVESAAACGLDETADCNGGPYEGAWMCQITHHNGRRFSAYDAYLKPARRRPNLEVISDAHATRILIDDGRASGVVVRRSDGTTATFPAARGVVVASGSYGSPQLLMLSGIGPASALSSAGIDVVSDAPEVGENLQDHPVVPVSFSTRRTDTMKSAESPINLLRYVLFRKGMLASNAIEALAFTRSSRAAANAPDLELLLGPLEWRNQALEPPKIHAFGIAAIAVKPRSRGRVRLRSADPLAPPSIDFALLSDPDGIDAAVMIEAIRLARKIAATPPLAAERVAELAPGEQVQSDAELRAWINEDLQTVYHPTSTCRMGSDGGSVVDPRLRVRGVDSLWVADASVMPSVPRGHTNAPTAMIAQRAAEFIAS
jgi:choline dehydrogenase